MWYLDDDFHARLLCHHTYRVVSLFPKGLGILFERQHGNVPLLQYKTSCLSISQSLTQNEQVTMALTFDIKFDSIQIDNLCIPIRLLHILPFFRWLYMYCHGVLRHQSKNRCLWNTYAQHIDHIGLTFDPDLLIWKLIGIIYSSMTIFLPTLKLLGQSVLEFLSYQLHKIWGTNMTFDLYLWPTDLHINRDHLLIKDYLPTKFEVSGAKHSWVISCTRLKDTDISTDLPTSVKQYAPPSLKGDIKSLR